MRLPAPGRQLFRAVIHLDLGHWLLSVRQAISQLRWDQNNISTVLRSIISTSLDGRYMLCDLSAAADIQTRVTHSTGERERNRPESFRLLLFKTIG